MGTDILVRAIIGIIVVFFTQFILDALKLKEPAKDIIFIVVLLLSALYIIFGTTFLILR